MTRCERCLLQTRVCMCDEIPRVETRTRVLVVRHASETYKPSNSGRLVALALTNCALLDYGARDQPLDETPLRAPGTWLLFPEGPPVDAAAAPPTPPVPPPRQLVVLDASWPQARRMYQRIGALRGLPLFTLPAPATPPDQLRTPPRADTLSTVHAVARALELLEGPDVVAPLERAYAVMIERSRATSRSRR